MTRTVLGRLVWKEYRLLRGFWGGMLLLCLVGQLVALAVAEPMRTSQPIDPAQYLYLVAVALTAFYVLGCGATAFAGERDAGTYLLQRVLPVTPGRLLLGKLLYTGLSALLLGVAAWVLAAVLVSLRGWHPQDSHSAIALLGGVKAIELLAWGVFFSLLTSRPLRAVVLAALTTSVVSYPLSWMLSDIPEQSRGVFYFPSFLGDVSTILPRLIIAALVLAYDVRLVARWFREPDTERDAQSNASSSVSRSLRLLRWLIPLPHMQRLVWQQLVRSRWLLAGCAGLYAVVMLAFLTIPMGGVFSVGRSGIRIPVKDVYYLGPMVVLLGLMGVLVFAEDQHRRQYRFFSEHGVRAGQVWWSRQVFWAAVLIAGLVVGTAVAILGDILHPGRGRIRLIESSATAWCLTFVAYASGQLCSQWIRRTLVAIPVSCALSLVLFVWMALMGLAMVSFWAAVLPIPIAFLFATRITANDWINERRGAAVVARKLAVLVVPVLVGCFVIYTRWHQIPVMHPNFNVTALTPEQIEEGRETARLYAQAWAKLQEAGKLPEPPQDLHSLTDIYQARVSEANRAWLGEHQDLVQLALQISKRKRVVPSAEALFNSAYVETRVMEALKDILLQSALQEQEEGKLDEALTRYLAAEHIGEHSHQWYQARGLAHPMGDMGDNYVLVRILAWANQAGQNSQRIRRAIDGLNQIWSNSQPVEVGVMHNYHWALKTINGGRIPRDYPLGLPEADPFMQWYWRIFPWERARAERLAAVEAKFNLSEIESTYRRIQENQPVAPSTKTSFSQQIQRWHESTPGFGTFRLGPYLRGAIPRTISIRRGVTLVLALEGWRCDHGQLPESLDELVPTWFTQLPLDPVSAQPYEYLPRGFDVEKGTFSYAGMNMYFSQEREPFCIPAHVPCLLGNKSNRWPEQPDDQVLRNKILFAIPTRDD